MNKLKIPFSFFLMTFLFFACQEKQSNPEPTTIEENGTLSNNNALLANKIWHTDGLYVRTNNTIQKIISPTLNVKFNPDAHKTIQINEQDISLIGVLNNTKINQYWTFNEAGTELTVAYLEFPYMGFAIQKLKVTKLTETELWVSTPDDKDLLLFGVINLEPGSEYRFSTKTPEISIPTTLDITVHGWSGMIGENEAGIFNPDKERLGDFKHVFNFSSTFFGVKLFLIDDFILAPATWSLSNDKKKLTLILSKYLDEPSQIVIFDVNTTALGEGKLWLSTSKKLNIYGTVIEANTPIRMNNQGM